MLEQSDYPPEWQCSSENKRVTVEVRVRDLVGGRPAGGSSIFEEEYGWIEIPTMAVEQWVEKGDAAAVQRTSKVKFPMEWGANDGTVQHNSPRQLVKAVSDDENTPYGFARVWFQNDSGDWILTQLGWIGGVGPSGDGTTGKFWVYDFAELLSSVPIGVAFDNPTLLQALEHTARLTNDNTPIPISGVTYMPPVSEELQAYTSRAEFEDEIAPNEFSVNVANADNVSDGEIYQYFSRNPDPDLALHEAFEDNVAPPAGTTFDGSGTIDTSQGDGEGVIPDSGEIGEIAGQAASGDVGGAIENALTVDDETTVKKFVENRDTLRDVYRWLQTKIGGKIHLEPNLHSVELVADVGISRRIFAQDSVVEMAEGRTSEDYPWVKNPFGDTISFLDIPAPYSWHEEVSVRRNDALFEIKPINTLRLRGDTSKSFVGGEADVSGIQEGPIQLQNIKPSSKVFPAIKLQVPSLLEAADGNELAPEVVESDANELDEGEREARRELSSVLEEATEGSVILDGEPRIMPYDRLDSFEVCSGHVTYEQIPVSYEVESVKHTKKSGSTYQTELNVSIWANEKNIETVRKEMVEVDQGETIG